MKQQIFIDDDYQYDYENNNGLHVLYYSNSEYWYSNIRGCLCMAIKDCGNGLSITSEFNKRQIDYSQSIGLYILLKLINEPSKIEIATKVLL